MQLPKGLTLKGEKKGMKLYTTKGGKTTVILLPPGLSPLTPYSQDPKVIQVGSGMAVLIRGGRIVDVADEGDLARLIRSRRRSPRTRIEADAKALHKVLGSRRLSVPQKVWLIRRLVAEAQGADTQTAAKRWLAYSQKPWLWMGYTEMPKSIPTVPFDTRLYRDGTNLMELIEHTLRLMVWGRVKGKGRLEKLLPQAHGGLNIPLTGDVVYSHPVMFYLAAALSGIAPGRGTPAHPEADPTPLVRVKVAPPQPKTTIPEGLGILVLNIKKDTARLKGKIGRQIIASMLGRKPKKLYILAAKSTMKKLMPTFRRMGYTPEQTDGKIGLWVAGHET